MLKLVSLSSLQLGRSLSFPPLQARVRWTCMAWIDTSSPKIQNDLRMKEVIQRYKKHTNDAGKLVNVSNQHQLRYSNYSMLRKDLYDKSQELSRMRGEDLDGLEIEELCKIEEQIQKGWSRVRQLKFDKLHEEIAFLKQKVNNLTQGKGSCQHEPGESINGNSFSSDPSASQDNAIFDTSLRLGLPSTYTS